MVLGGASRDSSGFGEMEEGGKVGNPFETKQWNRPSYRTWKLATLGRFMLRLGQMGNLCWLLL